jgi:hypothetical protein
MPVVHRWLATPAIHGRNGTLTETMWRATKQTKILEVAFWRDSGFNQDHG